MATKLGMGEKKKERHLRDLIHKHVLLLLTKIAVCARACVQQCMCIEHVLLVCYYYTQLHV